jgi:hypothetical protein
MHQIAPNDIRGPNHGRAKGTRKRAAETAREADSAEVEMQAMQDPRKPSAYRHPPAKVYADLETRGTAEKLRVQKGTLRAPGSESSSHHIASLRLTFGCILMRSGDRSTDEAAVLWSAEEASSNSDGANCKIHLSPTCVAVRFLLAPTYPDFCEFGQSDVTNRNVKNNACYCFSRRGLRVTISLDDGRAANALVCLHWGVAGRRGAGRR